MENGVCLLLNCLTFTELILLLILFQAEEKKRLAKLKAKEAADKKKAEKEAQRRIPASQLFTSQTDKFSKFDDTVNI